MQYQIDQSGKVEKTNKLTVVALANGKPKSLMISAVEKQKLIQIMRVRDYPRKLFIFKIFAGLVFLLLEEERCESVIIDREYPGRKGIIKDILRNLFIKAGKPAPDILFTEIGRKNLAHKTALAVYQGKLKPDMIVKAVEDLGLFY